MRVSFGLHIMAVYCLYRGTLSGSANRTAREERPIDDEKNVFRTFAFFFPSSKFSWTLGASLDVPSTGISSCDKSYLWTDPLLLHTHAVLSSLLESEGK